jgi:hypothetical protein
VRADTTAIRNQLGATRNEMTLEQRGIWNLSNTSIFQTIAQLQNTWEIPDKITDVITFNSLTYPWVIPMVMSEPSTITLCPKCSHDGTRQGSNILIQVFDDVIADTDSPALALQAILTIVLRAAYYDWVQLLNNNSSTKTVTFQQALIPLHHTGLCAVMYILAILLALCWIITFAFFAWTSKTLLNNSWQSIAQLSNSEEVSFILRDANMETDSEVENRIRESKGLNELLFGIGPGKNEDTGVLTKDRLSLDL